MKLRSAALTDIGKVRLQNQDCFINQPALGLFGVADGVGGLPGGAEAAECAARALTQAAKQVPVDGELNLPIALDAVNTAVMRLGRLVSPDTGIGTTLTCGVFKRGCVKVANVGDSRAYVMRHGKLIQLTEDHTVENEARRNHTPGDYLILHPQSRQTLTRCIGQPTPLEADFTEHTLNAGDRWIFATDGVTRLLSHDELVEIMAKDLTPEAIAKQIITLALTHGGHDNATLVLVWVDEV